MKHIIIGGVAGGATAAARIRRIDEFAEIILLEKGAHISYANCGLPYYVGGVIQNRDLLFVQNAHDFSRRFNIDVRTESEAIAIDSKAKTVTIRRIDDSTYVENFDKLLLAPGALAVVPPLSGIDMEGIFTLRNVADTDKIKNYLTQQKVEHAVVVGAGFIGLEMAENLQHAGCTVSIVEMGNQVMAPVDFSTATHIHQHLTQKGVELFLEQGVESFERIENKIGVKLSNGEIIYTDLVLLSIGVRPQNKLAQTAGLRIGDTGGIWVDSFLQTSSEDIYAVGDAIEFPHPLTGKPWLNYLANPANRQGRIVADNMVLGNREQYEGAIGTAIAKIFDLTVATTGLPAKRLSQMGIPYLSSITHSSSHAGYYPNAMPLTIKLTFAPDSGKIYGAQLVGTDGVDKRIDQIALLVKQGGSIHDLMRLEHAYAPPFSSAKDPIAIAGYTACNVLKGEMPIATWRDVESYQTTDKIILDVRTRDEFELGSITGAINIPLDDLRQHLNELPKDRELLVTCAIGLRGYLALKILKAHGFTNCKNLSGGYKTYRLATMPIPHRLSNPNKSCQIDRSACTQENHVHLKVDACGLQCPGPILKIKQVMSEANEGQRIEVTATDAGFARDAQAWCNTTGNRFISTHEDKGYFTVIIEKGTFQKEITASAPHRKGKTLIVFSDDLDKALATFVLANGAAATGHPVTLFFTFWGLNVIKKTDKPNVKKDIFGKLFGMMMPSHSLQLHLSKMSMLGIGDKMMRFIMKRKQIDSLESLRQQAIENGVEFIACQMSMDVMGVKREELLDEVTIGGVATYMERAESANLNLFI